MKKSPGRFRGPGSWGRFQKFKFASFARLVDLVKHAAITEMGGLRLGPAAEVTIDGSQRDVVELTFVLGQNFRIARAIEVPGLYLLRRRRVEEFHKGFRGSAALVAIDILRDHR